jgi:hypothetical protein
MQGDDGYRDSQGYGSVMHGRYDGRVREKVDSAIFGGYKTSVFQRGAFAGRGGLKPSAS